jgi:hypothetical protein
MPITCYLRHFSSVGMEAAADGSPTPHCREEEVRFLSGAPLSEEEAKIARAAGVTTLEVHGDGWGIAPSVVQVEPGLFRLSYLEEQASLVRDYGLAPLFSFCTRFVVPWQTQVSEFEPTRCLQHRAPLPLWSVWSRRAPEHIQRIVHEAAALLQRIGGDDAPVIIDAHGDYSMCNF